MADSLRYEYPGDEFAGAFVEFSTAWKRRELRAWAKAEGEEFIVLLKQKTVAVNLGSITEPSQFDNDALDDLDNRLFEWFVQITSRLYLEVNQLGEACGRLAWPISTETQTGVAPLDPQTNS